MLAVVQIAGGVGGAWRGDADEGGCSHRYLLGVVWWPAPLPALYRDR